MELGLVGLCCRVRGCSWRRCVDGLLLLMRSLMTGREGEWWQIDRSCVDVFRVFSQFCMSLIDVYHCLFRSSIPLYKRYIPHLSLSIPSTYSTPPSTPNLSCLLIPSATSSTCELGNHLLPGTNTGLSLNNSFISSRFKPFVSGWKHQKNIALKKLQTTKTR
jgi:hypothetical protein